MTNKAKSWAWIIFIWSLLLIGAFWVRDLRWYVVWEAWPLLLKGLGISWLLALLSVAFGSVVAVPLAMARVYGPRGIRHAATALIEIVRATPELMVVFWVFFMYPILSGKNLSAWAAAILALTLIAAAYLAEVIRSGIQSVPRQQTEASLASGLSAAQSFRYIILPQALRNMAPAFIAQLVMLFKTTSLVYVIGVIEFFRTIILVNNARYAPYALYLTMGIGYFVSCYTLSWLVRRMDPKYLLTE
jgi:His/Glu/Gln/Arg/opine family amino acid ABC transporter permease subunit